MKKLALFDIDGVIYDGHTIFDQIQDQERRGVIAKGNWDKILHEIGEYQSGRKNYNEAANSMLKVSALSLKGKGYQTILDDTTDYLTRNHNKFFPYFEKIMPQIKSKYDIYFVTTNFQFMCEALGKFFKVGNYLSSVAEVKNGKFTGRVKRSLAGNKGTAINLIIRYGKGGSIAVGDSENDSDMLALVEHPLVMEPNEKLKSIAMEKGWQIVNRDSILDIITSNVK